MLLSDKRGGMGGGRCLLDVLIAGTGALIGGRGEGEWSDGIKTSAGLMRFSSFFDNT